MYARLKSCALAYISKVGIKQTMYVLLFVFSHYSPTCQSFNIGKKQEHIRYIQSSLVKNLSNSSGSNNLPSDVVPSFFGYDFTLTKDR